MHGRRGSGHASVSTDTSTSYDDDVQEERVEHRRGSNLAPLDIVSNSSCRASDPDLLHPAAFISEDDSPTGTLTPHDAPASYANIFGCANTTPTDNGARKRTSNFDDELKETSVGHLRELAEGSAGVHRTTDSPAQDSSREGGPHALDLEDMRKFLTTPVPKVCHVPILFFFFFFCRSSLSCLWVRRLLALLTPLIGPVLVTRYAAASSIERTDTRVKRELSTCRFLD